MMTATIHGVFVMQQPTPVLLVLTIYHVLILEIQIQEDPMMYVKVTIQGYLTAKESVLQTLDATQTMTVFLQKYATL